MRLEVTALIQQGSLYSILMNGHTAPRQSEATTVGASIFRQAFEVAAGHYVRSYSRGGLDTPGAV